MNSSTQNPPIFICFPISNPRRVDTFSPQSVMTLIKGTSLSVGYVVNDLQWGWPLPSPMLKVNTDIGSVQNPTQQLSLFFLFSLLLCRR